MLGLLFVFVLGAVLGALAILCLLVRPGDRTEFAVEASRARAEIRAIRWETIARMLELAHRAERDERTASRRASRAELNAIRRRLGTGSDS